MSDYAVINGRVFKCRGNYMSVINCCVFNCRVKKCPYIRILKLQTLMCKVPNLACKLCETKDPNEKWTKSVFEGYNGKMGYVH